MKGLTRPNGLSTNMSTTFPGGPPPTGSPRPSYSTGLTVSRVRNSCREEG